MMVRMCHIRIQNNFRRHNGVDTSITFDATKWNCDGAELSSRVITLFYWIMCYNVGNTFGTNLPGDCYPFVLCTYVYVCVSCVLWFACIVLFSTYI